DRHLAVILNGPAGDVGTVEADPAREGLHVQGAATGQSPPNAAVGGQFDPPVATQHSAATDQQAREGSGAVVDVHAAVHGNQPRPRAGKAGQEPMILVNGVG